MVASGPFKNIAVVTAWPPTPDNLDWPTALPYYLLKHAPQEYRIHLFYFKGLEKYRELWEKGFRALPLASCTELQPFMGRRERWAYKIKNCLRPRLPLQVDWFPVRKKDIAAIRACKPDGLWLYPHWLTPWIKPLQIRDTVVTGPDSAILYHERWQQDLERQKANGNISRELLETARECQNSLKANTHLERMLVDTDAKIHVVGQSDAERFWALGCSSARAVHVTHPHYEYLENSKVLADDGGKMNIFVNGHAGGAYIGDHARRMVDSVCEKQSELIPYVQFDLVGKGWEVFATELREAGFEVRHKTWVDNYEVALQQADIALGLYAVGVGTKGKVLQAMASGVLVVGSKIAFENIEAVADRDYVVYQQPEELGAVLGQIVTQKRKYAGVAQSGAKVIRIKHAPEVTGQAFWRLFE